MSITSWASIPQNAANTLANTVIGKATTKVTEFAGQFTEQVKDYVSLGNNTSGWEIIPGNTTKSIIDETKAKVPGLPNTVGATDVKNIAGITSTKKDDDVNGLAKYGVTLVSSVTGFSVFFKVMPTISESRSATYDEVSFAQHPGALLKYAGTSVRSWSLSNVVLISRNSSEASQNQMIINQLRGWLMPYYGYGTDANEKTRDLLGAPPDILSLSAYGDYNIKDIPVVLTDLSIDWPNDVDYITTEEGEPFPVIMHLGSLNLREARSAREYSGFDITSYRVGDMVGAYNPVQINADQASARTTAQKVDSEAKGNENTETNDIDFREVLKKKSEPIVEPLVEKVNVFSPSNILENTEVINGFAKDAANSIIQNSYKGITQTIQSSLPSKTTFKGF